MAQTKVVRILLPSAGSAGVAWRPLIDKLHLNENPGVVHALRPAVVVQLLLTFDDTIQELRDLANVPVGINERTGSHYTTLQFLDGALPRDQIALEHVGSPFERYERLKKGELRVAALMEPYVSLALKEGAHIIGANFYRGAEVISPSLSTAQRTACLEAVNEASDLINADFARYKHYIVEPVKGRLSPEELGSNFVHYAHSRPMDEARFDYTYEWMRSWNLTSGESQFKTLVAA